MTTHRTPETTSASGSSLSAASAPRAAWPCLADEEIHAAMKVLRSGKVNYWTGDEGRLFEKEFAEFTHCKYAVALANGTVALEAALRALGVGPGDEIITTARTFIASASCAVAVGARPVIADVDRDSQNLTTHTIRAVLTRKTKAIVAVHLAGWPCEMDDIVDLARQQRRQQRCRFRANNSHDSGRRPEVAHAITCVMLRRFSC